MDIALLDFDGTLSRGDSILPYLLYCMRQGAAPREQLFRAGGAFLRQKMRQDSLVWVKEVSLSFLRGMTEEEAAGLARGFWREQVRKRVYPEAAEALQQLRQRGLMAVVVSASPDCYMRLLPEFLPADAVIATHCEVSEGRYTGRVEANCKGENKVKRVREWLKQEGLEEARIAEAYGDSLSDLPMLMMAIHPILINPSKSLREALPQAKMERWH